MQFHEFGDPNGAPLVFFMGTPQKGDAGREFSAAAQARGVRLICPTRPWYDDRAAEPSFETCSASTARYLADASLSSCHVMGGSGGGPFALHFACNHPEMVRSCYLLAAMGTPETFREHVKSPPTLALLSLFRDAQYDTVMTQLGEWGLPADLAHGAWGDFQVLLGSWESMPLESAPRTYVHHGEDDDNAPIESIRDLARRLPNAELRVSPNASHAVLATDESFAELVTIFKEVAGAEG